MRKRLSRRDVFLACCRAAGGLCAPAGVAGDPPLPSSAVNLPISFCLKFCFEYAAAPPVREEIRDLESSWDPTRLPSGGQRGLGRT